MDDQEEDEQEEVEEEIEIDETETQQPRPASKLDLEAPLDQEDDEDNEVCQLLKKKKTQSFSHPNNIPVSICSFKFLGCHRINTKRRHPKTSTTKRINYRYSSQAIHSNSMFFFVLVMQ